VLRQLGMHYGASIFDYGCSWGYGSYPLAMEGLKVTSFEVAQSRSQYAIEKLAVDGF
jgi:cyclopropane fatty-acyl-phospholipid synthase-like methyltransferase